MADAPNECDLNRTAVFLLYGLGLVGGFLTLGFGKLEFGINAFLIGLYGFVLAVFGWYLAKVPVYGKRAACRCE